MTVTLWTVLLLLTASPEPPAPVAPRVELGAIALKVPLTWQRRERSGTHRFDAPKGNAYFVVDTGEVQTAGMEPSVCLGKITHALGKDGGEWHKLVLGGFPAAHRSAVDVGKGGGVTVRTHTFVGCNGTTTWSLLFHMDEKEAERYEPEVVALAKSLEFLPKETTEAVPPAPPQPAPPTRR